MDAVNTDHVLGDASDHTHVGGCGTEILPGAVSTVERIQELSEAEQQAPAVSAAERPRDRQHRLATAEGEFQCCPLVRHTLCQTHRIAKPVLGPLILLHPTPTDRRTECIIVQCDEDPGASRLIVTDDHTHAISRLD